MRGDRSRWVTTGKMLSSVKACGLQPGFDYMEHVNTRENPVPSESWDLLENGLGKGRAARTQGKILIVDASLDNRQRTKCLLGDLNHELMEASSTSEAIGSISLHRVDLVLMDLAAPQSSSAEC